VQRDRVLGVDCGGVGRVSVGRLTKRMDLMRYSRPYRARASLTS
jgi:hypothetical protein